MIQCVCSIISYSELREAGKLSTLDPRTDRGIRVIEIQ